jgi:hypothetical protein
MERSPEDLSPCGRDAEEPGKGNAFGVPRDDAERGWSATSDRERIATVHPLCTPTVRVSAIKGETLQYAVGAMPRSRMPSRGHRHESLLPAVEALSQHLH